VQIEIVWQAARIRELSDADYAWLHRVITYCSHRHDFKMNTLSPWGQPRLDHNEWRKFNGICGHMHVPENDHVDPGKIKVRKLV
jgi:hypothetical protein